MGASVPDRALSASPTAPEVAAHTGNDPSREQTPWLHLRGQFTYHGEALISGTKPGLIALRDALTKAIEERDAELEAFASDGEGYAITIRRCARIRDMGSSPYIDELARASAEYERDYLRKTERYHRSLWDDRWAKARSAIDALKLAREWVEGTALACGYHGCTPETCASKRAELDLLVIDAAIARASGMSAGTAETAQQAQGVARQPGGEAETPKPSDPSGTPGDNT